MAALLDVALFGKYSFEALVANLVCVGARFSRASSSLRRRTSTYWPLGPNVDVNEDMAAALLNELRLA